MSIPQSQGSLDTTIIIFTIKRFIFKVFIYTKNIFNDECWYCIYLYLNCVFEFQIFKNYILLDLPYCI